MSSHEKIKAMLIIDIIGRPPKHLVETLEKIIEEMGKEKGVEIKSKDVKEPAVMKDNKEFYTTFAEIEVEVEDILYLAILMFKYMPAHIEVISPENISLSNNGWSDILSELARRIHAYDEVARVMQIEYQNLLQKAQELGLKIAPQGTQIEAKQESKPEKTKKTSKNKK
jgi:hypothetical protein